MPNSADSREGLAVKFRLSEGAGAEHDPYAEVFAAQSAAAAAAAEAEKEKDKPVFTQGFEY